MADGRRILITGLASPLASRLAARLQTADGIDHISGVDLREPTADLGSCEFIRADLRNPLVAKVVDSTRVDTIVHLAISPSPSEAGGRTRMKELNVIGTMQLLAAAQKSSRVRTFVMKSTTAVYGSSHRAPALIREDAPTGGGVRGGYAKDAVEVEGYARAFGRRRPDVDLSILRFANFLAPGVSSTLASYFRMPVLPTALGHDPRIQLLHLDDAVEVLARTTLGGPSGVVNVAGPGVLYLSQAVRMTGRPAVPIPAPLIDSAAGLVRRSGRGDVSPDQLQFFVHGRIGDISRLRDVLGYEPRHSTRSALEDFLSAPGARGPIDADRVARWESEVRALLGRRRVDAAPSGHEVGRR